MAKKSSNAKQQAAPYSTVRNIVCVSSSEDELARTPENWRRDVANDLVRAQYGLNPKNGKSLANLVKKAREIRVGLKSGENFRVAYLATNTTVYVLVASS